MLSKVSDEVFIIIIFKTRRQLASVGFAPKPHLTGPLDPAEVRLSPGPLICSHPSMHGLPEQGTGLSTDVKLLDGMTSEFKK